MAEANLKAWFKVEMTFEGGRVDDPQDPGGRTAYGVTQRVYNGYRKARGLPIRDVWTIDSKEIVDIFKTGYWGKVWGDRLPDGVDVVVADGAVNSGVSQAVKWLQRALGVRVDGIMGDATLTAAAAADARQLIKDIIARREAFLRSLKTFRRFGKGWIRRTQQLQTLGLRLADGDPAAVQVSKFADMGRKARLEDAKPGPPKLDAVWGAGTGTGALAQVTQTLEPLQNIERISHLLTAITVIGVLLGIAGGIYSYWARNRTREINDALDVRPALPSSDDDDAPPDGLHDAMEAA